MNYKEISIAVPSQALGEELMAVLCNYDYEGFEEKENELLAYIPVDIFNHEVLKNVLNGYKLSFSSKEIEQQNWNAQWEAGFEPVIVDDFCSIRADFHTAINTTEHEIIITPKMSFGTGHHATTVLMIRNMRHLAFKGKRVLDFGTGTGILAILAEKLGASSVLAIDNDEWSFLNAAENITRNNCEHIKLQQSSLEGVDKALFDIVLANINRHILLQYMSELFGSMSASGILLMSGLLTEDENIITQSAMAVGFNILSVETLNNWIAIKCVKY